MGEGSQISEFYVILLHNFIATCFGLCTKRNHQAKLEYQLKVIVQITLVVHTNVFNITSVTGHKHVTLGFP